MKLLRTALCFFIVLFSANSFAGTYYVSPSGSGSTCSLASPCSLATANSNAVVGDIVYIQTGTYSSAYINPSNSGTSGSYITYENYGGAVTISGQSYGININGKNYIKVSGITVSNCTLPLHISGGSYNYIYNSIFTGGSGDYYGSHVQTNSNYNRIDTCTFANRGSTDSGGLLSIGDPDTYGPETPETGTYGNLIENSTFYGAGHHLLIVGTSNNTVRNNFFHNEDSGGYGHRCLWLFGFDATYGIRTIVEGNRIGYAGTNASAYGQAGILANNHYSIIRYNSILKNKGNGIYFYTSSGYIVAASYNKVYNNTLYDNDQSAQGWYAIGFQDDGNSGAFTGNVLKNNLFWSNGSRVNPSYGIEGGSGVNLGLQTFASNYDDANGNPLFVDATGSDPTSITYPNMNLQSDSPAKEVGGALTTVAVADTSSGTTLIVADAGYFQDGTFAPSGTISADWIAVGTVGNVVQIASINYSTNTIILANTISRSDGQNVWLYKKSDGTQVLYGSAPDAGAFEYTASASITGCIINMGASVK